MTRASDPCSKPGCPNLKPCPDHRRRPWASSRRRDRTRLSGSVEAKRAKAVISQADGICYVCGQGGADAVDHKIPLSQGGADSWENLGAIHSIPCHRDKTQREARAGRQR